ncbi:MAG: hypothetical protein AAF750_06880 [Planctomycetota bacterium]
MTDTPPPHTANAAPTPESPGLGRAVRPLFLGYTALAAIGLPLTALLTATHLRTPALITGAIVLAIALLSVLPLWLSAKTTSPAAALNAVLGSVVIRLMLTAAGLLGYLLTLSPELRRPVGLIAVAWFAVSWIIELGILLNTLRRRPQATP